MRRMTYFVMALALVLGFAQCKKEQPTPQSEGNVVMITLNVDGGASTGSATNGSRAEVEPPHVTFVEGDTILVASDGKYVGYLVHNGSTFNGNITNPTVDQPLYFYFLGNKIKVSTLTAGTTNECTVNISDQSDFPHLPVISMGVSHETYPSEGNSYTSRLYNKASLMKFNVITPSTAPICITGMNNEVTVNFNPKTANTDDGFTFGINTDDGGLIKMPAKGANNETWAIVLPQDEAITTPYSEDGYSGTSTTIHKIEANKYYNDAITMEVETPPAFDPLATPLTLEAVADGTITFNNSSSKSVTYRINGGAEQTIPAGSGEVNIPVVAGNKVAFYGNSSNYQNSYFQCTSDCYIYGNIMSLVNSTGFPTAVTLGGDAPLANMFASNTHLINHPTKDLVLPATTLLSDMCYMAMFQGCTGLTRAPELPATTLSRMCYANMFQGCTGLTTAPVLPATTLKNDCYNSMFSGCSNLNSVTCLATNISASGCTSNWLNGVAATGTFYADPTATWPTGNNGIPTGWTRLNPDGSPWVAPAPAHEYVDLGLPSGLLWATCNVGADAPEEYGDYFAWGETQTKTNYNWSKYQYCNGNQNTLTKYCNKTNNGYNGFTDDLTTLLPEDDAATANWGSDWRMPTKEEWEELYNNTTRTWTQQGGVYGRRFTATNGSGNSLFLPAAGNRSSGDLNFAGSMGYYWSSSLNTTDQPFYAWRFYFDSGSASMNRNGNRYYGQSVRAVRSAPQN